jgi:uncharacterized protein (DUF305 family)
MKLLTLTIFTFALMIGISAFAQHDMNTMQGDMSSNDMLSGLEGQNLEISFLSMMIEHHKGAIDMANWILERTQNPDIKTAAEAIIAAQNPEIEQMTAWLQDWYGQGVDERSTNMMQGEMDTMMGSTEASANPDVAFLQEMSLHHNSAIDMAQVALLKGTHTELRELAKNIIVTQSQELAQYQNWLDTLAPTSQIEPNQDMDTQHGSMQYSSMQYSSMQRSTNMTSPYTDQLNSSVRGLSQEEIDGLLAGEGMGYARNAELNGYPGPRHILDIAKELQLTFEQADSIKTIFNDMNAEAVRVGQEIISAETLLSQSFSDKTISDKSLQVQLGKLANLYAQLRETHLQAHLAVTPMLNEEQLVQYQVLRGYTQN